MVKKYIKRTVECAICKGNANARRALCSFCNETITKEYNRLKLQAKEHEMKAQRIYQKWLRKGLKGI